MSHKNSILITHTDLDGISCAVLAKVFKIKFDKILYLNYHEITEHMYLIKDYKIIIITDLSLSQEEHLTLLNLGKRVVCFDHHESSNWLNNIKGNFHDTSRCGTKIFFEEFILTHAEKVSENVFDYVKLVNVFDLWKSEDKLFDKALNLNRYFTQEAKLTDFLHKKEKLDLISSDIAEQLLKQSNSRTYEFTDKQLSLIRSEIENEQALFNEIIRKISIRKDNKGLTFGIYENPKFSQISILAHRVLNHFKLDYVLICFNNCVSIRAKEPICLNFKGFNGHPKAASATFTREYVDMLLHNKSFYLNSS